MRYFKRDKQFHWFNLSLAFLQLKTLELLWASEKENCKEEEDEEQKE